MCSGVGVGVWGRVASVGLEEDWWMRVWCLWVVGGFECGWGFRVVSVRVGCGFCVFRVWVGFQVRAVY